MFIDEDGDMVFLKDENDIYSEVALASMVDDDEISAEEAGFMRGYNDAM